MPKAVTAYLKGKQLLPFGFALLLYDACLPPTFQFRLQRHLYHDNRLGLGIVLYVYLHFKMRTHTPTCTEFESRLNWVLLIVAVYNLYSAVICSNTWSVYCCMYGVC